MERATDVSAGDIVGRGPESCCFRVLGRRKRVCMGIGSSWYGGGRCLSLMLLIPSVVISSCIPTHGSGEKDREVPMVGASSKLFDSESYASTRCGLSRVLRGQLRPEMLFRWGKLCVG